MSLARAVTRRIKRTDASSPPARSQSVKTSSAQIDRTKISLPVALVSTTNMLSYNAPDLPNIRHVSSSTASTHSSADDSDHSASTSTTRSRASTLTEASSVESSPTSPAPNHLSGYFPSGGKQVRKSVSTNSLHQVKEETDESTPAIPQRALSHSKRAHERLAAKRSLQNIHSRGSTSSQRNSREQRSSIDMFSAKATEETHPFGRELEQLNEVVEEFGGVVRDAETDADLNAMRSRNLAAFCAADYLAEIRPLFGMHFGFPQQVPAMAWI